MHRSYTSANLEGYESVAGVAFYEIQEDLGSREVEKSVPCVAFGERNPRATPFALGVCGSIGPLKSARTPTAETLFGE